MFFLQFREEMEPLAALLRAAGPRLRALGDVSARFGLRNFMFEALGLEDLPQMFPPRGTAQQADSYVQTAAVMQRNHANQHGLGLHVSTATATASSAKGSADKSPPPPGHCAQQDRQYRQERAALKALQDQPGAPGTTSAAELERYNSRLPSGHPAGRFGREVPRPPVDPARQVGAPRQPSVSTMRPPLDSEVPGQLRRRSMAPYTDTLPLGSEDKLLDVSGGASDSYKQATERVKRMNNSAKHQRPYSAQDLPDYEEGVARDRRPLPQNPLALWESPTSTMRANIEASHTVVAEETARGLLTPLSFTPLPDLRGHLQQTGVPPRPGSATERYLGPGTAWTAALNRDLHSNTAPLDTVGATLAVESRLDAARMAVNAADLREEDRVEVSDVHTRFCRRRAVLYSGRAVGSGRFSS